MSLDRSHPPKPGFRSLRDPSRNPVRHSKRKLARPHGDSIADGNKKGYWSHITWAKPRRQIGGRYASRLSRSVKLSAAGLRSKAMYRAGQEWLPIPAPHPDLV